MEFANILEKYHVSNYEDSLDDLIGRQYEKDLFFSCIKHSTLDDVFRLPNCFLYYLTGPVGCGKSYLAKCFAESMRQNGYELYYIEMEELLEENNPEKLLKDLFEEIEYRTNPEIEGDDKFFLFMEKPGLLVDNAKAVRIISRKIRELLDRDCRCIIVCCSQEQEDLPQDIIKYFDIIELDLPDEALRREFFDEIMFFDYKLPDDYMEDIELPQNSNVKLILDENGDKYIRFSCMNYEQDVVGSICAEETEKFNFHQLIQITDHVVHMLKSKMMLLTNGNSSMINACISQNDRFFISDDEFKIIAERIRKTSLIHERAVRKGYGSNSFRNEFALSPQVIYQQIPASMSMMSVKSEMTDVTSLKDSLLSQATEDDPDVSTLFSAYDSISKDLIHDKAAFGVETEPKQLDNNSSEQDVDI